jgi:predicted aspartyl protease
MMGLHFFQDRSTLRRLAALAAVVLLAPAHARDPAAQPTEPSRPPAETPTVPATSADQTGPLYATPTRRDRAGRIVAPVEINGRGPFRFILDTGANRSAISAATAEELGLEVEVDAPMGVHGVTGSSILPSVEVASLRAGEIDFGGRRMPVLPQAVFGGTDGILGIDALQDARVEVDFARDRVTIRRSSGRRAPYG